MAHDTTAAIRNPRVRALALGRCTAALGQQIMNVAIGWQLYDRTGSAWALGLVGLFQLLPVLLLGVAAGNAADKFSRRNSAIAAQGLLALANLGLALVAATQAPVAFIYALLFVAGITRAYSGASTAAALPQLIAPAHLANANAWVSSAMQAASIAGPAIGGLIIAWTGTTSWAYAAAVISQVFCVIAFLGLPEMRPAPAPRHAVSDRFAGLHFIRRNPIYLAAFSLDMFAVLLGGVTALLPMFAKDILHVGADGLGWLRTADPIGSLFMALCQTRLKPWRRPGRVLLVAVAGFGLATVGFGLSTNFVLSFVCLMLTGVFDSVSIVIRSTIEQALTPDHLRGRVRSFSLIFIGFSNEFGALESGATAALMGPVLSAVAGGLGTLAVVAAVTALWPALMRVGPLASLQPIEEFEEVAAEADQRHAV